MTLFVDQDVTTHQIEGAIALEVMHDLRLNNLTFPGFPSIKVSSLKDDGFTVSLSVFSHHAIVSFKVPAEEAFSAAKSFNKEKRYAGNLFEKVQAALIELELAYEGISEGPESVE